MIYSLGQIRSSGVLYRSPICLPLHLWQTALFYLLNASIASQNKVKVERNGTAKTACRHRTKNLCPILLSSAQFTCNATAHACATDHPPNHARGMRTVHNDLLAMSPACRRLRTTIKCFQHSTIIAPGSVHAPTIADRRRPALLPRPGQSKAPAMARSPLLLVLPLAVVWVVVLARADPMLERFEQWMGRHGRLYADAGEKQRRLEVYRRNVELVERFNSMSNVGYRLVDNKFADLTNEEFRAKMLGFGRPHGRTGHTATTPSSTVACVCILFL